MSARKISEKRNASEHPRITRPLKRMKVTKGVASKFVHYFVPHKRNDYKPLFLHVRTVSVTTALILVLFVSAQVVDHFMITSGSPQVAAVVVSTLIDLANADRTTDNLPSLTVSPLLMEAAQEKADDEAAKGYFAHISPDGRDPWYWFSQAGYDFTYAGENLAVYFSDSNAVNTAWMNSPEHRANILSDHFTEIGIATAQGLYQGQETTFVVQEFGTPAAIAEAPVPDTVLPASPVIASAPPAAQVTESPAVKGASAVAAAPQRVKVIQESPTYIAVENLDAPAPQFNQNTAGSTPAAPVPDPTQSAFWKFVTSPQTDLAFLYGIIGAITAMALILEVAIEARRQHPHRIVMGLSLITLMIILIYAGHTLVAGQLLIV
jgi:hypothetical protein